MVGMAGAGIEVSGLTRSFGDVRALDGLSLQARPGEVTALIGPNGAGKTTLLLVLATLLAPDDGMVRVCGLDPVVEPRAVRAQIGWMPDGFGTWDTLTVTEVLTTVAQAYRIPRPAATDRVREVLALVHLDDLAERPARVLSRGQKQRLGLARALVHDPSVLLLDEPASGLDPRSRIELRDILRAQAAAGRTVLVSSHILTELQEMADRAVVVAKGRTVTSYELRDAVARPRWRVSALDGPALDAALAERGGVDAHVNSLPTVPAKPAVPGASETTDGATNLAKPYTDQATHTIELDLGGERDAAALVTFLVGRGVEVCGIAPAPGGDLEAAYLDATESGERA